jgi:hypothetical protein
MKNLWSHLAFCLLTFILSLGIESKAQEIENLNVTVDSIISKTDDGAVICLRGGKNLGIAKGVKGYVLTKYVKTSDLKDKAEATRLEARDNTFIGKVTITDVKKDFSIAEFTFFEGKKKLGIFKDDLADLNMEIPNEGNSLLKSLAAKNIRFKRYTANVDRLYYYSIEECLKKADLAFDIDFIEEFTREIQRTGRQLTQEKYKRMMMDSGRYAGMNLPQAMRNTTFLDVALFLEYVHEFPYKYLGYEYRTVETYASFIISHSPVDEMDEARSLAEKWLHIMEDNGLKSLYFEESLPYYFSALMKREHSSLADRWDTWNAEGNKDRSVKGLAYWKTSVDSASAPYFYQGLLNIEGSWLLNEEKYKEAIAKYRNLLKSEFNLNAYWGLQQSFGSLRLFDSAYRYCGMLIDQASWYPYTYHSMAWYHMLEGKPKEALPLAQQAFYLEELYYTDLALATAVNLGHIHSFLRNSDSADYYYDLALSRALSEEDYMAGFSEDFDTLIKYGYNPVLCRTLKNRYENKWQAGHKNIVFSRYYFEKAKNIEEVVDFDKRVLYLDSAIFFQEQVSPINPDQLRTLSRWLGYAYYKQEKYPESLKAYEDALKWNRDFMKNESKLISDYRQVGNLLSWLDDDENERIYRELERALKAKVEANPLNQKVNIIGLSTNKDEGPYAYCSNDVRSFIQTFTKNCEPLFDTITDVHLNNAGSEQLLEYFSQLNKSSRPDDMLIIYYSGPVVDQNDERAFLIGKDTFTLRRLFLKVNGMPHRNVLMIADAPNSGMVQSYMALQSDKSFGTSLDKNVQILAPRVVRIEADSLESGYFSQIVNHVIKSSGDLTSSVLANEVQSLYAQNGLYLTTTNYSSGKSFMLKTKDIEGFKRGITTRNIIDDEEDEQMQTQDVATDYALLIATKDYDYLNDLGNPVRDVKAIGKILQEKYGYKEENIEYLINPTHMEVKRAIVKYKQKTFGQKDQLMIYVAGHGIYVDEDREAYLGFKNSRKYKDAKNFFFESYVNANFLRNQIDLIPANNIFVILDVCYAGTFFDDRDNFVEIKETDPDKFKEVVEQKRDIKTRAYIASVVDVEAKDGYPGGFSPFNDQLQKALNDKPRAGRSFHSLYDLITYMGNLRPQYGFFGTYDQGADYMFEYKEVTSEGAYAKGSGSS